MIDLMAIQTVINTSIPSVVQAKAIFYMTKHLWPCAIDQAVTAKTITSSLIFIWLRDINGKVIATNSAVKQYGRCTISEDARVLRMQVDSIAIEESRPVSIVEQWGDLELEILTLPTKKATIHIAYCTKGSPDNLFLVS